MANYTANNEQTIFDVVINTISDLNSTYKLIISNDIPNIETKPIGYPINYTPPTPTPPTISSSNNNQFITKKYFYSVPNQSVYDVVLQTYGDLNKTYQIIKDSNFSNILSYPLPSTLFTFNPTLVSDAIFASYLSKNVILINTVDGKSPVNTSYLLEEDGFDFLLEDDSGKIELEN